MWFRSILGVFSARSSRTLARSRCRQRPRSFRPLLEILEDRLVPSNFVAANVPDLIADIQASNAAGGSNTIALVAGNTFTLTAENNATDDATGLPVIAANDNLTIVGNGDLIQRSTTAGTPAFRFFDVAAGASLTLQNLTLQGGETYGTGGAIYNAGILNLSSSTLTGNTAWGGYGGAIDNSGSVDIRNSTLFGNSACGANDTISGGGILVTDGVPLPPQPPQPSLTPAAGGAIFGGVVNISNSTIALNTAVGGSTSVYWYTYYTADYPAYPYYIQYDVYVTSGADANGGALDVAELSVDHCTIAGNAATGGYGDVYSGLGYGAGIYSNSNTQIYDTILANNAADFGPDVYGSITSLGHNLVGNSSGGSGYAASDLLNVNPQLGALQNNGGATQAMALLAGSPAIDAGDNTGAPDYDQRGPGFARIVNGIIDIGAFEVQTPAIPQASSFTLGGFPSSTVAGVPGSFTITAKNTDGTTATHYAGTVHFTSSDPLAELPADYTFVPADNSVHTFSATLKTAGTQSLTASDTTGALAATDGGITVNPAAASKIIVAGFPSPTIAGTAGNFTVTVEDLYGNIAGGYAGTVHFTSSDAKAVPPANYTFTANDAGTHTFNATLKTTGTQSITATDTVIASLTGTDTGITVNPAAASKFILTAPANVSAGASFSLTLRVEDAYGNVVTNYTGTVHVSSTDKKTTLPANYTFTTTDKGVHTFSGLVLRTRGNQKITISDTHNSSLTVSVIVDVL